MPLHREAEMRRAERLGLFVYRGARSPPPRSMHEWPMCRVHEPHHGVIDVTGKAHDLAYRRPHILADIGQMRYRRHFGWAGFVIIHENPDAALRLAYFVIAHADIAGIDPF